MIFTACNCNKDGSRLMNCDVSGQCECKENVGGDKCDACMSGFIGFPECKSMFKKIR